MQQFKALSIMPYYLHTFCNDLQNIMLGIKHMELSYKVVNKVFLAHENRRYLSSVSLSINTQIKCNALQYITDTDIMLPSFTFKDTFVPSKTLTV